jgi:hypothetical protein
MLLPDRTQLHSKVAKPHYAVSVHRSTKAGVTPASEEVSVCWWITEASSHLRNLPGSLRLDG